MEMWHIGRWFCGHGGDSLMLGLDDGPVVFSNLNDSMTS